MIVRPNTRLPAQGNPQRGSAALPMGVLLLFIAALILIAVSRTTLMEQRMSGNEIRTRQALQAAQAGIDQALAYMRAGGIDQGPTTGGDGKADTISALSLPSGASFQVYYCNPAPDPLPDPYPPVNACEILPATCGPDFKNSEMFRTPLVLACGVSDDGLGRQAIVVNLSGAPSMATTPENPVISKGAINVQGSATIVNYYNNLTIWTGDPFSSVGAAGKTFVRNPSIPQPAITVEPPDQPNTCVLTLDTKESYICMTDKTVRGPDIIDDDVTLGNLTDVELFQRFFGTDFITYRDSIASRVVTSAETSTLANINNQAIVITGSTANVSLPSMGTRDKPVVVIIEGNWAQGGNSTIYGVVYVMGNVDVQGNVEVRGNVTVEGVVGGTGSLDIIYDPFALHDNRIRRLGKAGQLSGSWRDWL